MAPALAQRDAGAGLLHPRPRRCARDALRLVDLDENAQPVKIEFGHKQPGEATRSNNELEQLYKNDMQRIRYLLFTQ